MEPPKEKPSGMPAWKPVSLTRQLVFDGGYLPRRKTYRLETKEIATESGVEAFVKIDKRQEWLLKAACGRTARHGALKRTKIFDELKKKLVAAVAAKSGEIPMDVSSDSQGSPGKAQADPMAALAEIAPGPKKQKLWQYASKRGKDNITGVVMPAFDLSAHPGDERQRVVHLLATSTTSMWLAERDIAWLVTCIRDEYQTGGVPLDAPSAVAGEEAEGNCAAPGVIIRWDFDGAWEATILRGEQKGQTCKSKVAKLTAEKWAVVDKVHHYGTDFASATPEERKKATWHFLELHMQGALS